MRSFEREQILRETLGSTSSIDLHLATYFRVRKPWVEIQVILGQNGLSATAFDPIMTPPEVVEQMWEERHTDETGIFTFEPGVLVLGHTLESVKIPDDAFWRMRQYFTSGQTNEILPLTTNVGAPLLHPGSQGPQTYEIVNESNLPLKVNISDLVSTADVFKLSAPSLIAQNKSRGTFRVQTTGKIDLGIPPLERTDPQSLLRRIFEF
jgi:deoxycytidine triphosphate deaminase